MPPMIRADAYAAAITPIFSFADVDADMLRQRRHDI